MRLGGRKDTGQTPAAPAQGAVAALTTASAVAIAAVIAALAATLVLAAPDHAADARQRAERDAAAVAGQVAARMAPRRAALDSLAGTPALHEALATGDRASLTELAGLWRPAFPDSARLLIAPAAGLDARPQADPPVGYALSEMVGEAIDSGRGRIEVHHAGGGEGQLNLVAPVRRDGEALGALVVTYPSDELTRALDSGFDWRLVQAAGGTQSTIATHGSPGDGPTVTATVSGTPWRVERPVPAVPNGLAALDWQPAAMVGAGAVLLIALTGAILGRRLRAALQHDGGRVTALVDDLCEGQLQLRYPTATPELAGAVDAAVARARAAGPIGGVGEGDAPTGAPRERPEATAEPDHGLEVTERPAGDDTPEDDTGTPPEGTANAPAEVGESRRPAPAATENMTMDFTHGLASGATHSPTTNIDRSILRAYDIRGVVGKTLTVDSVRALGQAIGSEAAARGQSRLVVGYDGRHSSPELAAALTEGLVAAGREVIEIGCVPTPVVYFAAHFLGTEAGVAITGSHNPPDYNGLKMVVGGETLSGEAIQDLGRRIAEGDLVTGEGSSRHRDVTQDYLDRITQDVALHRPLKLVIDCGNGVAGNLAPTLFRALGCEVTELYCDVDGDFPNHHPDPTVPGNLTDLIDAVRAGSADLGIAFDGDGDRLGVVDDRGKIIWADRQMMLFARDVLSRQPGADIIFDVKCTSQLADVITENAGVPLMWKTGHSLVKAKMRETGAPLAGEMSGHIFFQERWYGFDDGLYAGARLLEILSMEDRAAHAVFDELPEAVSTPELRVELAEGEPPEVMARLMAEAQTFEAARIADIDGLRVDFPDGWGLVRASNTQPSLVLRFEGNDEAALARIQDLFRERLDAARPGLQLPF